MIENQKDPPFVVISTWVYALLLVFYPTPFRRKYGPHMAQVFRDCCLKAYHKSGSHGLLSLWALTLFDWFKTVLEEQTQRGTEMTREKYIRLSGWGMILSGISLLLGFLASNMDSVLGRSLMGSEVDRYENISTILIMAGTFLLVLGFVGLLLRYGQQTGRAGKIALVGGAFFGSISLLGGWTLSSDDNVWSWTIWFSSFTMMFVCLTVFGTLTVRKKLLPRWNALPLVAGIGIPIFVLVTGIWEALTPGPDWVNDQGFGLLILLFTAVGIGLLGFTLQGDPPLEGTPA